MTFGHTISSVRFFAISLHDRCSQLISLCELLKAKDETMTENNYSACISLVNLLKEDMRNLEHVTRDALESEKAREYQEVSAE